MTEARFRAWEQPAIGPVIYTIGHSTRPLEDFLSLLQANGVAQILDVRTVPRSRRYPQFNRETLPDSLQAAGIGYTHLPGLGGLRHPRANSPNGAWRNLSFRGYADYMQTAEFAGNVQRVVELAGKLRCALMCAEAVPWRCHRSLIADALIVRGVRVEDIIGPPRRSVRKLTLWSMASASPIHPKRLQASRQQNKTPCLLLRPWPSGCPAKRQGRPPGAGRAHRG